MKIDEKIKLERNDKVTIKGKAADNLGHSSLTGRIFLNNDATNTFSILCDQTDEIELIWWNECEVEKE